MEKTYPLEVQADHFLNGFSRKDYCFSRGLQSTIPGDGLLFMVGLTSRVSSWWFQGYSKDKIGKEMNSEEYFLVLKIGISTTSWWLNQPI